MPSCPAEYLRSEIDLLTIVHGSGRRSLYCMALVHGGSCVQPGNLAFLVAPCIQGITNIFPPGSKVYWPTAIRPRRA